MATASERSPDFKLLFAGIIGLALIVPLMMEYALVWDRQEQSNVAQNSIAAGWGGAQAIVGPVLVIPYAANSVPTVEQNGRQTTRIETSWDVRSSRPSPSFDGDFLPTNRDVQSSGFKSSHAITNLAWGKHSS